MYVGGSFNCQQAGSCEGAEGRSKGCIISPFGKRTYIHTYICMYHPPNMYVVPAPAVQGNKRGWLTKATSVGGLLALGDKHHDNESRGPVKSTSRRLS